MMKLTVLYTPPSDLEAFEAHYLAEHLPLAAAIPGLVRAETSLCVATPDGSPLPYHRIAELYFDDADSLGAGFATEQGRAASADAGDLAGRTGSTVTMVVSALD